MKKLAILFLLTTVLAFSAFAIDGVGDFNAGLKLDMPNAQDEVRGFVIKPWIDFSKDLVENFNLYLKAEVPINFGALKDIDVTAAINEFHLKLTYGGIAAGPGNIGFFLDNNFAFPFKDLGDSWSYKPTLAVTYGGIAAGPGTFGAELGADFAVVVKGEVPDDIFSDIYLGLTYGLEMGLSFTVKPFLAIQPDAEFGGLYAKIGYAQEAFGASVEIDKFTKDFKGFPIDVYGEAYLLDSALTAGAHITFGNINGTGDVSINPGVYVAYKF
jgi:hypothetical protein